MIRQLRFENGLTSADVNVGMPLTGRNNLAEGPLLALCGDLRWEHISAYAGVPSSQIHDAEQQRLYATFFYVETCFSWERPMAFWQENDEFTLVGTLNGYDGQYMDGYHYICPPGTLLSTVASTYSGNIPYIRSSNAFVRMVKGASWLKKAVPVHEGLRRIPALDKIPETYSWIMDANEKGSFGTAGNEWIPMHSGILRVAYTLNSDRDLNGVGLLYFANYPVVLDICERKALTELIDMPMSEDLVDARTTVRRRSAYLCNINIRDKIDVDCNFWIRGSIDNPGDVTIRADFQMYRRSDGRKMMVSTVEKRLFFGTKTS